MSREMLLKALGEKGKSKEFSLYIIQEVGTTKKKILTPASNIGAVLANISKYPDNHVLLIKKEKKVVLFSDKKYEDKHLNFLLKL